MKTTKTYSIEEHIYDAFDTLAIENNLNKSSFFEDVIKKYLDDNDLEVIGEYYELKNDTTYNVLLLSQNKKFCYLNGGDKIQRNLFYDLFKPVNGVDPKKFFDSTAIIFEDILNKVKSTTINDVPDAMISNTKNVKYYDSIQDIKVDIKNPVSMMYDSNDIDEQSIELSRINNDFRNLEYLTKSKLDICNIIIKLKKMYFYDDKKSEELRELLIHIYTEHKESLL